MWSRSRPCHSPRRPLRRRSLAGRETSRRPGRRRRHRRCRCPARRRARRKGTAWSTKTPATPAPRTAPPARSRPDQSFGPNRSTSQPWSGEKNVCSTIRRENVTCSAAGVTSSAAPRGLVNSAQTYCGLEIAIMQIRPSPSWTQRVAPVVTTAGRVAVWGMGRGLSNGR